MKQIFTLFLICLSSSLYAQLTYVPDNNFEAFLEANGMGNGIANDDYVTTANISGVTTLNISAQNITDLTGIAGFAALTQLDCYENLLTSLDLSSLPLLERVDASENLILNANLTQNPNLVTLSINENFLTTLDVSQNLNLENLFLDSNSVTAIDLSSNSALAKLSCSNNRLTSLNIKNGTNTNITTFVTIGNPDLNCIEVDNAAYATTNWTNIDIISSFNEDCSPVLSTESFGLEQFSAYPNPVESTLYLDHQTKAFEYTLSTIQGQQLIVSNTTLSKEINFKNFESGLYILTINDKGHTKSFKIIKR